MGELVTIGMIGCGGMAGAHRRGYQELWEHDIRNFRIVATCDVEEERAVKMADEVEAFQGKRPVVYTDIETLLEKEREVMAVDVNVLHRAHHSVAIPCLQAGKHVTVEKPMAITMRTGRKILEAAERASVVLQVAENYRRTPEQRAIKWTLSEGRIGKLRMIYWLDIGERLWYWSWRDHKDMAGGGWSLDGGVHFADLFRYHIGDVQTLYAGVETYNPIRYRKHETLEDPVEATVEDTTIAVLHFEGGVLGQWTSTGAAPGYHFNQRVIYGETGSLHLNEGLKTRTEERTIEELCAEHKQALGEEGWERFFPRGITDSVATELKEFIDAILCGTPVETDGMEGYKAEAISIALYESAWLGRRVSIEEVESCRVEGYQQEINESLGVV
ncbi:MAG: Gfo/Idh/MocA family oxidoreductase [Candidatus Latescibacteria bacterium]|nr:Gfo/Idh/MocA family oxidoreductase [Candidatus Latescibacterota bacterium]